MEMPMKPKTASPRNRKTIIKAKATKKARIAMARRRAAFIPCVSAIKTGARPGGSMMMNSVVNAAMRAGSSVMMVPVWQAQVRFGKCWMPPAGVFSGKMISGRWLLTLGLFQLFEGCHPHRFGPFQPVHNFGVFLVPSRKLACFSIFIEDRISELLS